MATKEIRLSRAFKTQASKAVISILLFGGTYFLVLIFAVGLTAMCAYLGIMLIINFPRIFTILLGIGLASLGFFILIFLLKFLFKSHKIDRSNLHEINKEDEPELFDMIHQIVVEVGTSFPKKVYLSADINAAVFYDSSFWSMFFPIKKNLQIGLGLVNTVTSAELKAILAHEFGHFSQKTMKVGSYVYNVNKIIFNMLYDNESYQKLINSWSNASGYFSIFVSIAVKIIEGIQWLLRKLYTVVNKNYMALSREMEFHADEIAANVTGSEPLKSSLLRMSFADHSFNSVLSFYERKIAENVKSQNLFKEHLFAMNFQAAYNNFTIKNSLPEVTTEELNKFNKSKLVIKDQWSSHPAIEERIERLNKLNIPSLNAERSSANKIFRNVELTQQRLTDVMFEKVEYKAAVTSSSFEEFKIEYEKQFLSNTFSKIYNGYYDNKNPVFFEMDDVGELTKNITMEELFSDQNVGLVYEAVALKNDIAVIKDINEHVIDVNTFDYDGNKFEKSDGGRLISELNLKLENINEQIKQCDKMIFNFFSNREQISNHTPQLENFYRDFFDYDREFEARYDIYAQLTQDLQFIGRTTPFEQIDAYFQNILPVEAKLKAAIKAILATSILGLEITEEIRNNLNLYLSKHWSYFDSEQYKDDELRILFAAMNNYAFLLSRGHFLLKKNLLNYQEQLYAESEA